MNPPPRCLKNVSFFNKHVILLLALVFIFSLEAQGNEMLVKSVTVGKLTTGQPSGVGVTGQFKYTNETNSPVTITFDSEITIKQKYTSTQGESTSNIAQLTVNPWQSAELTIIATGAVTPSSIGEATVTGKITAEIGDGTPSMEGAGSIKGRVAPKPPEDKGDQKKEQP